MQMFDNEFPPNITEIYVNNFRSAVYLIQYSGADVSNWARMKRNKAKKKEGSNYSRFIPIPWMNYLKAMLFNKLNQFKKNMENNVLWSLK